jgi:hypothetical protein
VLDTKTDRLLTVSRNVTLTFQDRNTSIVTLRVVGGDEKGSLKPETLKYGHECQGTRTRERLRWREPAEYTKDRPQKNKTVTFKE